MIVVRFHLKKAQHRITDILCAYKVGSSQDSDFLWP